MVTLTSLHFTWLKQGNEMGMIEDVDGAMFWLRSVRVNLIDGTDGAAIGPGTSTSTSTRLQHSSV